MIMIIMDRRIKHFSKFLKTGYRPAYRQFKYSQESQMQGKSTFSPAVFYEHPPGAYEKGWGQVRRPEKASLY